MRFIAVRAWLDVRYRSRDGVPIAPSSPGRASTRRSAFWRGWAPQDKGGLHGHIFFHNGDDSGFPAGPLLLQRLCDPSILPTLPTIALSSGRAQDDRGTD